MRYRIFILAALAALAAHAVQMASQPWVTNRIAEAVAAIPAARADLTPATNYTDEVVSSATNNLRAKTDMAVYDGFAPWTMQGENVLWQFVWNAALGGWYCSDEEQLLKYESGYWNLIYTGEGGPLPISDPVAGTGNELRVVFTATGQIFTRTEIVAPSDDRLATTGGIAVAIASAVPAGVVVTNEYGAVAADLTIGGILNVNDSIFVPRGGVSAETLNVYISASIGLPEKGGILTIGGTNVMDAIAARALATDISTNNPAFVAAVANCPVALTSGGNVDYGDFGQYGTVGALLAALAAAVVALRKGKANAYNFSAVETISSAGTEQSPNEVTPVDAQNKRVLVAAANAYIAVALPAASANGHIRDFMLTLDCTSLTEGDEPTVTWGTAFHPRTDAGTDFACAAGVRNVYYISEYAQGEFVVGGWQETEGGNA